MGLRLRNVATLRTVDVNTAGLTNEQRKTRLNRVMKALLLAKPKRRKLWDK